jgi:anti-sigma B factor antagonist
METIKTERREPAVIFRLRAEIAQQVSAPLREEVQQALEDDTFDIFVFDLSEITVMDSSGIGFLVAQNTRIKGSGKTMYLLKPSPQVRKALELVQLINFFAILDDEDDLEALLPA